MSKNNEGTDAFLPRIFYNGFFIDDQRNISSVTFLLALF
jgi:hypothetical protein